MRYNWIKSIPDYEKFFNDDAKWIIANFGIDGYIKMLDHFGKNQVYFSTKSILDLKKEWAIKNKHIAYDEAARTLDVSVKTIYNWRQDSGPETLDLFEENR